LGKSNLYKSKSSLGAFEVIIFIVPFFDFYITNDEGFVFYKTYDELLILFILVCITYSYLIYSF